MGDSAALGREGAIVTGAGALGPAEGATAAAILGGRRFQQGGGFQRFLEGTPMGQIEKREKERSKERRAELKRVQERIQKQIGRRPSIAGLQTLIRRGNVKDLKRITGVDFEKIAPKLSADIAQARGDVGRLRDISQTVGPTSIAEAQVEQQRLGELTAGEQIQEQQALEQQQSLSQLAAQGGAGAGARERLAAGGAAQSRRQQQELARFGQQQRADITAQDEARKLALAQALPGQQLQVESALRAGLGADQAAGLRSGLQAQELEAQRARTFFEAELGQIGKQEARKQARFEDTLANIAGTEAGQAQLRAVQRRPGIFGSGGGPLGVETFQGAGGAFFGGQSGGGFRTPFGRF